MSKKIVVPIDGSEDSYKIIPYAIQVAALSNDHILFLNIQQSLKELGYEAIRKAAQYMQETSVPYEAKIRVGIPAMEIIAESSNPDVRCIVMAKGRGKEEAIGSVSEHVLKLSTCPIVFVPRRAIDGSL